MELPARLRGGLRASHEGVRRMRLTISRKDLYEIVSKGAVAAERNPQVPIMSCVRLTAGDGWLSVASTNHYQMVEARAACGVEGEGAVAIPADFLSSAIGRLPDGDVLLETDSGHNLRVSAGKSRLKLETMPAADWPELSADMDADSAHFTMTGATMARILTGTLAASSLSHIESGILLHARDLNDRSTLTAVGTNRTVLLLCSTDLPEGAEHLPIDQHNRNAIVISTEVAGRAIKLFRGEEAVDVSADRSVITIQSDKVRMSSRLLDITFPDYDRLLRPLDENIATVDHRETTQALGLVEVFTDDEKGSAMSIAGSEDGLLLTAGDGNQVAHQTVAAEVDGEIAEFGISSRLLKVALGAFKAETLWLSFKDAGAAAVLASPVDHDTVAYIAPMALKQHRPGKAHA
ncbi:DNA polymerase III subunit beta [Amorphus sp. MBR-141]